MSQSIISKKKFEYTLSNIPKNFKILPSGNYKDDEIEVQIQIAPDQINNLNFNFIFTNYPKAPLFWAIITVQIQDKKYDFFLTQKTNGDQFSKSFTSPFRKEILFEDEVQIAYKIIQIPTYICKLNNDNECLCYLNSSIQLLFHLAKFRSLLFSYHAHNKNLWISQLHDLFAKMCFNKESIATEELTKSFGWPSLARKIPQDPIEFLDKLLEGFRENITDTKIHNIFDEIFQSQLTSTTEKNYPKQYTQYMMKTLSLEGTLEERIKRENIIFHRSPEVLFISVYNYSPSINGLPKSLDIGQITGSKGLNHSKYTLSGFIILYERPNLIRHYTSMVRASKKEIWLYFTDKSQTTFSWLYDPYLQINKMPLEYQIKESIGKHQISVLMYIADDVLNEYFCFTPNVIPPKCPTNQKRCYYKGPTRLFLITTPNDIKEYVKTGHTDFRYVKSSIQFELSSNLSYNSVYQKVSEIMNIPIDSFILKAECQSTGAPYYLTFKNSCREKISNFSSYKMHFFFNEFNNNEANSTSPLLARSFNKYIPFYFLYFKFNPRLFIHKLTSNLTHSNSRNLIQRAVSESASKELRQRESDSIDQKKDPDDELLEKNCYHYLTSLVLYTESQFKTIIPELVKALNKPEETKIKLYTAEYDKNKKVGYKELDVECTIKECFQQIMNGIYIYVQCVDDFIDDESETKPNEKNEEILLMEEQIKSKFLFFKYYEKVMNKHCYPKEISNTFIIENYSVPVTFCKMTDPKRKSKTMLFPFKLPFNDLEQLKKMICIALDEEYPENGLMQLFFGFRDGTPPFNDSAKSQLTIEKVVRILDFLLKNSKTHLKSLNLAPKSTDSLNEVVNVSDSDSDYYTNIFIHYHIFKTYDKNNQISIRVYFSEDSVSIKCFTQILINKKSKVSDIAKDLLNIFPSELSDEDKNNLTLIKENNYSNFTDFYRIIETSDGKISREFLFDYQLQIDSEIRFERIPNYYKKEELNCLIPAYYGALYNNTKYVGSFGTPFYFPVLNEDLEISKNLILFKESKAFKRLKHMIKDIRKGENICLHVVNFKGLVQDVEVSDLKTIIQKNLSIFICIKNINASIFIDEPVFFAKGIQIIK